MFKIVLALTAITLSIPAISATVSHNGYTLDTDTNIVTGGGLQWLQWDETAGLSINQALAANPGMRLATDVEMAALFNAFDFGGIFDTDENTHQVFYTAYDGSSEGPHEDFIELFGNSENTTPGQIEPSVLTTAYYGEDLDEDGLYNIGQVIGDSFYAPNGLEIEALALLWGDDALPDDTSYPHKGSALVSSVPIPAAAWLFGSALLTLAGLKRRKAAV